MLKYSALNKGELCNGSTADSDSVCWGSNPYSPAKEKQTIIRWSVFLWQGNRGSRTTVLAAKPQCTGFAYPDRRSTSSLVRRREWVSSRTARISRHRLILCEWSVAVHWTVIQYHVVTSLPAPRKGRFETLASSRSEYHYPLLPLDFSLHLYYN